MKQEAQCQQPIDALNMSLRMRLSGNKLLFSRLLKKNDVYQSDLL